MEDWKFLYLLLDKVQSNSSVISKIWMRALFIFRILILGTAAEIVWADQQPRIVCNTQKPGCDIACYNYFIPISPIRYWIIQVIAVSMPTLLYLCHVIHVVHKENTQRERIKQKHDGENKNRSTYIDEKGQGKIQCNLFASSFTCVFFKIFLELVFMTGHYYLYGFIMRPLFSCRQNPCPYIVDCYMSHVTEKNIFNVIMYVIACVSLLLSVIEAFYLLISQAQVEREAGNEKIYRKHQQFIMAA
ncbi:gap junction Cx32.2 protein-like [Tachysurus vachellii]|uniref:gap junction Cx32.2 protein-like n=1 Tax=Tachysurus vachellii TaxID=175792 RepID=UPI00296A95A4|nr:gap junction Cx32.2 protein-like [Tachysurus vachellii]XP_060722189.1 gap junction Cx32.2 protein-like [Tachysurus vachellii]